MAERLRNHSGVYWEPVIAWHVVQSFNKNRDAWDEYVVPITADNHLDKDNPILRYPDKLQGNFSNPDALKSEVVR